MEIAFEVKLSKNHPERYIIKHAHFLCSCLMILNALKKMGEKWHIVVREYIGFIIKSIEGSYMNMFLASNVFINLLKHNSITFFIFLQNS